MTHPHLHRKKTTLLVALRTQSMGLFLVMAEQHSHKKRINPQIYFEI